GAASGFVDPDDQPFEPVFDGEIRHGGTIACPAAWTRPPCRKKEPRRWRRGSTIQDALQHSVRVGRTGQNAPHRLDIAELFSEALGLLVHAHPAQFENPPDKLV